MRWVLIAAVVLVGVPAVLAVVGMFLPRGHVVRRSVRLRASPAAVWAVMSDLAAVPAWWPYLSKAERIEDRDGLEVWLETRANRWSVPLVTVEATAERRMVRRLADAGLSFAGEWTYEIDSAEEGSVVRVTERGEVKSPVLRVFARAGDPRAALDSYLKALARRLGEEVQVMSG